MGESQKENVYIPTLLQVQVNCAIHSGIGSCYIVGVWQLQQLVQNLQFACSSVCGFESQQHPRSALVDHGIRTFRVGRSSGNRALCFKGLDPPTWRIDPACRMHLQFRLFSVPTSDPQLVHQRLSCLWESAHKRSLAAYQKEQPVQRHWVSSKEIYYNDHTLDIQQLMI